MLQITPVQAIQLFSNVVLATFTVVLAIATYLYYVQSRRQTEEMQATREAEFKPVLKAGITHNFVGTHYWFEITNIGKSAAQDVHGEWYVEGMENEKKSWDIPVFQPQETHKFNFPLDYESIDRESTSGTFKQGTEQGIKLALDEEERDLVVDLKFSDPLGKEYDSDEQRLPIIEGMEGRMEAGEFKTESEM